MKNDKLIFLLEKLKAPVFFLNHRLFSEQPADGLSIITKKQS
jgi:hypothetical protein